MFEGDRMLTDSQSFPNQLDFLDEICVETPYTESSSTEDNCAEEANILERILFFFVSCFLSLGFLHPLWLLLMKSKIAINNIYT